MLYDPTSPPTIEQQFQHYLRTLSQDKYCCPSSPTTRHIVDLLLNDISKEERYDKQIQRFLKKVGPRHKTPRSRGKKISNKKALKDPEQDPWWNDKLIDWVQARAHETEEIESVTKKHLVFTYPDWWATDKLEECPPPEALFPEFSHLKGRRAKRLQRRVVHLRDIRPRTEPVFFTPMFLMLFPQLYPTAWREWARRAPYVIPVPSPHRSSFPNRQPTTSADKTT